MSHALQMFDYQVIEGPNNETLVHGLAVWLKNGQIWLSFALIRSGGQAFERKFFVRSLSRTAAQGVWYIVLLTADRKRRFEGIYNARNRDGWLVETSTISDLRTMIRARLETAIIGEFGAEILFNGGATAQGFGFGQPYRFERVSGCERYPLSRFCATAPVRATDKQRFACEMEGLEISAIRTINLIMEPATRSKPADHVEQSTSRRSQAIQQPRCQACQKPLTGDEIAGSQGEPVELCHHCAHDGA